MEAEGKSTKESVKDFLVDFVAGSIGGAVSIITIQPLDLTKVLLQSKGSEYDSNFVKALGKVFREEGILGMYKGMVAPIVGSSVVNCLLFGLEGNIERYYRNRRGITDKDEELPLVDVWKCGSLSGLLQSVVSIPSELIKIQMQVQHLGNKTYKNNIDCMKHIFKDKGIFGFYRGISITLLREIPSYGLYFAVYHGCKRKFGHSKPALFCAGGFAGLACWIGSYPIDVIKTKIQTQPYGKPKLYKNTWECIKHSYYNESLAIFGKGTVATMVRSFPMNGVTFLVYDTVKKLLNEI